MQQYTCPELEIIKFNTLDIICASSEIAPNGSERDNAYVAARNLFGGNSSIDFF